MFNMSHDIAHCSQATCPRKDSCVRYQAHLDAVERRLDYLSYLIIDDPANCTAYWEDKK